MKITYEKIYYIKMSAKERIDLLNEIQDDLQHYPTLMKLLEELRMS